MKPGVEEYDVAVISSSPLMILEALRYRSQGLTVAVFDDRERIGGAWYVKDLFGYKNVEVGCHFIYNDNRVYDFLDHIDSSRLERMRPQPSTIISGINRKSGRKLFGGNAGVALKGFFFKDKKLSCRQIQLISGFRESVQKKRFGPFLTGVKDFFNYTPYRYFRKGCGEFMQNISALVQKAGLQMNYNVRVCDVVVQPSEGGYFMAGDREIHFKKVLISKHVKFDSLTLGHKIEYERQPWRKKHFVFHIRGKMVRAFSYIDIVNDKILKRVSDVGIYCDGIDQEHILVCADTTEEIDAGYENQEIKDLIFIRLKELKLITKDAVLLDYFVEKFVSDYTPAEMLEELHQKSGGVIVNIDTSDMGKSIRTYRDNWEPVLKKY